MKENINIQLQQQNGTAFQKAFSVLFPVIVYYVVVSMVNTVFAIWFSHQVPMIVKAIAMGIGGIFLYPIFYIKSASFKTCQIQE